MDRLLLHRRRSPRSRPRHGNRVHRRACLAWPQNRGQTTEVVEIHSLKMALSGKN